MEREIWDAYVDPMKERFCAHEDLFDAIIFRGGILK